MPTCLLSKAQEAEEAKYGARLVLPPMGWRQRFTMNTRREGSLCSAKGGLVVWVAPNRLQRIPSEPLESLNSLAERPKEYTLQTRRLGTNTPALRWQYCLQLALSRTVFIQRCGGVPPVSLISLVFSSSQISLTSEVATVS